jgi:hypothetical protein
MPVGIEIKRTLTMQIASITMSVADHARPFRTNNSTYIRERHAPWIAKNGGEPS